MMRHTIFVNFVSLVNKIIIMKYLYDYNFKRLERRVVAVKIIFTLQL